MKLLKADPYFLTHPLSSERKKYVYLNLKNQKIKNFEKLNKKFFLVKAKIDGFFLDEEKLDLIYKDENKLESIYAFSMRNYRIGKIKKALMLVNKCIELDNKNPFFF